MLYCACKKYRVVNSLNNKYNLYMIPQLPGWDKNHKTECELHEMSVRARQFTKAVLPGDVSTNDVLLLVQRKAGKIPDLVKF